MLCLGQKVSRDECGVSCFISDHNHFAGTGKRINVDSAVNTLLRQRDEKITGTNDLVDRWHMFAPIRHRRDRLRAAHTIDLCYAKFVTSRQHVSVVGSKISGRCHHSDFFDACDLSGNNRHQNRRRIRRGAARNTNADAAKRNIPLGQRDARLGSDRDVLMQNCTLKLGNVVANATNRIQKSDIGFRVCSFQIFRRYSQLVG